MNPLLGLAFGLLLVKALLPSTDAREAEGEDPEARRARIARRKARRAARQAKPGNQNSNPDPGSNPGNNPAT